MSEIWGYMIWVQESDNVIAAQCSNWSSWSFFPFFAYSLSFLSFLASFHFFSFFLSLCTPWLLKGNANSLHRTLNDPWLRNRKILALSVVLCNHCAATRHWFICVSAIFSSDLRKKKVTVTILLSLTRTQAKLTRKGSKQHRSLRQKHSLLLWEESKYINPNDPPSYR